MRTLVGRVLVEGHAEGEILRLDQSLSLWGGVDTATGEIIDPHHPQVGASVKAKTLVMPSARGSSSSSSVLAEMARSGSNPAAIVLGEPDPILGVGAIAARLMYDVAIPIYLIDLASLPDLANGSRASLRSGGIHVG